MDLKLEIDEFNRTRRQKGEPVMTQQRLAELLGISPALVSLHISGTRSIDKWLDAYRQALRMEVAA